MQIYAYTQPYSKMRYPTIGDYKYKLGQEWFKFFIAKTGKIDFDMAVFQHEFFEAFLCWKHGIKEEDIIKFDLMFEEEKKQGFHNEDDEPGDDPRAPYYHEHQGATAMEKMFLKLTNNKWKDYCKTLEQMEVIK